MAQAPGARRGRMALVSLLGALVGIVTTVSAAPALATPVATDEATYEAYGRAFPDPHGCTAGLPTTSPWAKGNVCAVQYLQWNATLDGLAFLEQRFDRYIELLRGEDLREVASELTDEELQSAGLPREDLSRAKRDLVVVKVTDDQSPVPEPAREHFAYALSIHGIERAGLEGGIRAAEDLVTWAACEQDPGAAPACATDGPFPKPILEPSDSGPTAGEVVESSVVYLLLANPDGWRRGEWSEGGVFFQRYNGNGMDLNRDWPTVGYTEAQYTPFSEPETRGYGKFLSAVSEGTDAGRFTGGIDLHGMLTAPSFSFTLLGAGERDLRKNELTVDTAIRTFRDSETRLAWSPLIAPAEDCPGPIPVPELGGTIPMCSDQWGTVWDTINYQITGGLGDWIESPIGLGGIGIDNEMALSHLTPNNVYEPGLTQLHIDGNKGLIFSQLASLLEEQEVEFSTPGKVGFIFDPRRIENPGGEADDPGSELPPQDGIEHTQLAGIEEFRFDVKGEDEGFRNLGLTVEATFGNLGGISTNSTADLILDYCGPPLDPGDSDGCREIARYFNQSPLYLQAGARIDLNSPPAGPYRIRPAGRLVPTRYKVSFSGQQAYPEPEQGPYDVSRMDFFSDLNRYAPEGEELEPIPVGRVLRGPPLREFDTIVVADDVMPGFVPEDEWREAEPAGPPQDGESFSFGPEAAPAPGAPTEPAHEFEVKGEFDNDRMIVSASWFAPSDYDLHVEFLNPETDEWESRGCECAFVNTGEEVTVFEPQPGTWRVRLENFLAAPQEVEGTIRFEALPSPGAGPGEFTARQFDRYVSRLARFAAEGGNLVLTDGAIPALPFLGADLAPEEITGGVFYAGWKDFNDGVGPTYDRHHLAAEVDKEGTAEGEATVDGQQFENRHQTYEPVPLGYYVGPSGAGNSDCDTDRCDSPNWIVAQGAWEDAGGTTAARSLVRETETAGSPSHTGTSLGEVGFGTGVVRIAGGLLPDPTERNHHPFGLASYALTYTGYQLVENLLAYERPGR
ncbi:MAG: M14 family zinc carboxypeptidase [Solirubrobacterales bacterium]